MLNALISFGLRLRWLRIAVERLHLRELSNGWLRRFPLVRSLSETGIIYRISSLNSLGVAHDIFYQGAYDQIRPLLPGVRTFADIGCNSGFFTCFLVNATRNSIRGLLVDANPEMVHEAKWHLNINRLSQMRVTHGVVGGDPEATEEVFYLHPDTACSSCYPSSPDGIVTRAGWQPIHVRVLSLTTQWQEYFGDTRCDLLKIDIEGSEANFIKREANFVASVRFVLLEIHHWLVDANVIENQLAALGFELRNLMRSFYNTDVRLYVNCQR